MLKILQIDKTNSNEDKLYRDIVRFNNSQNPIDEKTFVANTDIFIRLQQEFEKKGFLLLIKQSDKNKFAESYKSRMSKLREVNSERMKRFDLPDIVKPSEVYIPLEKLLQVINAFVAGGYVAYVRKSNMLKFGSEQYNTAIDFIKGKATVDTMLDLFLLYRKAEDAKKKSEDKRTPIPYYLIDAFAKYECGERNPSKISSELATADDINRVIKLYNAVTKGYCKNYQKKYDIDYNKMIKRAVDYDIIDEIRELSLSML